MRKLTTILITLVLVLFAGSAFAAQKIAIVPFNVNAEKDMTFLQNGIYDMLANRLQTEGLVDVVGKQTVMTADDEFNTKTTEGRRGLARKLNASYVVGGTLSVFGNNVSVDIVVTANDVKVPDRNFSDTGDMSSVVNKMDGVADNIKAYVTGATSAARANQTYVTGPTSGATARGDAAVDLPPVTSGPATAVDNRTNPELSFKRDMMGTQAYVLLNEDDNFAEAMLLNFWKGPSLAYPLRAIALGDVDGDGYQELVVASKNKLYIYRMVNETFSNVGEIPLPGSAAVVSLGIADVNRNGVAEIFVTRQSISNRGVQSTIVESRNGKFEIVVDNFPYYMSVTKTPTRGDVILAQRHKSNTPFQRNLVELVWQDGTYVPDNNWRTSYATNPIGATIGEMQGAYWVMAFDDMDYIRVYNDKGKQEWESSGPRGGSSLFYELNKSDAGNYDVQFLPSRIAVRNLKYSPSQMVVASNEDAIGRKLAATRNFTEFMMYGYTWNGIDMELVWKTRKTKGFARDFVVGDFGNTGADELVILLVQSEGDSILTEPKGVVISYKLPPDQPKEQPKAQK